MKIILSSASKARLHLLKQVGIEAYVSKSKIQEEAYFKNNDYKKSVVEVAEAKAIKNIKDFPNSIIIAADTIVCLENTIFGKPKNDDDARKTLETLSGKKHSVITGIFMINTKTSASYSTYCKSYVKFKKLTEEDISGYIKTREHEGSAGSYSIQGTADVFVEYIKGSYSNIVGLPLHIVFKYLKKLGYDLFI